MVWINHSKEIEEKKSKFLKMSPDQYDKYMCEIYPIMFKERNLPMTETCMCWSFCIGKGWYWILADLCEKLEFISKQTGINVVFSQIKEKFGGARFYYSIDSHGLAIEKEEIAFKFWHDIIDSTINHSEELCDYYCAECGENKDDTISVGGWVYDLCEKCLEKNRPVDVKVWKEQKSLKDGVVDIVYRGTKEEIEQLKKMVKICESRIKKQYAKQQKEWDKAKKKFEKERANKSVER